MRHYAGLVFGKPGVQRAQSAHPGLDVASLSTSNLSLGRRREVREVAVLDADQVGFAQREVEMEVDETVQGGGRVRALRQNRLRARQEPGADTDQQFDQ